MRKLLLAALTLLVALPMSAADAGPALPTTSADAVSSQVESIDAPTCRATRPHQAHVWPPAFESLPAADEAVGRPDGPGPVCPKGCPQFAACCPYNWCIC
jgi:hypothetical protein